MVRYLLEHMRPSDDGKTIVAPAIVLDTGQTYIGRLEHDMQFVGAGKHRTGRPRYMVRMFVQQIGEHKAERDKLARDYKIRFRSETVRPPNGGKIVESV